jgi:hypothetical protein
LNAENAILLFPEKRGEILRETPPWKEEAKTGQPFLKNLFLPNPANPINPAPKRSMVVGSGIGAGPPEI